jgi:hypothetical protein
MPNVFLRMCTAFSASTARCGLITADSKREDIAAKSAAEVLRQHTSTGIPGAHKQDLHNVRWRPIVEVKKRLPLGGPIHAFVVPTQEVDAGRISRRSWKDHRGPV